MLFTVLVKGYDAALVLVGIRLASLGAIGSLNVAKVTDRLATSA